MSSTNIFQLIGNVGQTVRKIENSEGQISVVSFSLAANEWRYNPETRQNENMTEWFNVKAFGYVAARIAQFAETGRKFHLFGRAYTEQYEKDGVTHYSFGLEVKDFDLLPSGTPGGGRNSQEEEVVGEVTEDEFPF